MKCTRILTSSIVGMLVMSVIMTTASIMTMTANSFIAAAYAEERIDNKYPTIPISTNGNQISSLGLSEENRGDNSRADGGFLTYTNDTYGISIQYPQDWAIKDNYRLNPNDPYITIVSFFAPPGENLTLPRGEVSIYIDTKQYKTTLEDYVQDTVLVNNNTVAGGWEDLRIIEAEQNSTLAKRPAYKVELTYRDQTNGGPVDRYLMDTGTILGNKVYVVSFWANPQTYSEQLPSVQKMIDSFEILVDDNVGQNSTVAGGANVGQPESDSVTIT